MSPERPPLLLRLAVVVGAFALLLGVAGVALMVVRGDEDASAAGPGLEERLRVVGAAAGASLEVSVRWEEGAIIHLEAAHALPGHPHLFLLPPRLAGRRVVIEVRDTATSQPLASREIEIERGREIRIEIEPADAPR